MVASLEEKDRPAYIRFERRAVEDRAASEREGHFVSKDVDFAIVTPVGTKDEIPRNMAEWIPHLKQQVREGRLPASHEEHYIKCYEAFKKGEDLPTTGTPIKGWPVLSPAQQTNCIAANVRTVEDLAILNGEGAQRIGMGAQEMKSKAEAWLKASKDIGLVVQSNAVLLGENARLKATVESLTAKNNELAAKLQMATGQVAGAAKVEPKLADRVSA